jgi:hypothetical protein
VTCRRISRREAKVHLELFVTVHGAHSGRRTNDRRLVLDGIFRLAMHEHFGKWLLVYLPFQRWTVSVLSKFCPDRVVLLSVRLCRQR